MKNLNVIFAFLIGVLAYSQCPTGNVSLTSQSQVNAFGENYPSCETINGNLIISGNQITDLSPLSNIASISGDLELVNNSVLPSLNGLHNITNVNGHLLISTTNTITDLSGLQNLNTIGKYVYITRNNSLTSLNGLNQLSEIGGYLYITYNNALTNIDGVSNINPSTIESAYSYYKDLMIFSNPELSTCAISTVCSLLEIEDTYALIDDNGSGCDSIEEVVEACANVTEGCAVPSNISASVNGRKITVSYTLPQGATLDVKAGTAAIQVANPVDNRLEFRNRTENPLVTPNLTANTQYFFRLRSDCSGANADNSNVSPWSDVYTATTDSNSPMVNNSFVKIGRTTLSPNPAKDIVKVSGFDAVQADIYNTSGVVVRSQELSNNNIQLHGLPAGNYTIQLTDKEGRSDTKHLIKK